MEATLHSIAGVERCSQLFLTDGVRASIGTIVTEAQHVQVPVTSLMSSRHQLSVNTIPFRR